MIDLREAAAKHTRSDGTINTTKLAKELGWSRTTLQQRLARIGLYGTAPVLPGFGIKKTSATFRDGELVSESVQQAPLGDVTDTLRPGFAISKISTLRDAQSGTIVEWTQQKPGERTPEEISEIIKRAFSDYVPAAPLRRPMPHCYDECLTLYPLPDMHIGMFAWGKEVDVDWDLKIAQKAITAAIEKIHLRTAPSRIGVVLVGGDAVHSDTNENKTAKSGNVLQVDGRYDKVVDVTQKITVRQVELALDNHEAVEVRVLRGNHDEITSVAIANFLRAWFRNEPRVTVDLSPSLFWWRQFGKVFLAATHGHEARAKDMPMLMASRRPEIWGATKHRYAHTFHFHNSNKTRDTIAGVIVETHEAPCPQDGWHYGQGYMSGRSLCSITYDPERGEAGVIKENL